MMIATATVALVPIKVFLGGVALGALIGGVIAVVARYFEG